MTAQTLTNLLATTSQSQHQRMCRTAPQHSSQGVRVGRQRHPSATTCSAAAAATAAAGMLALRQKKKKKKSQKRQGRSLGSLAAAAVGRQPPQFVTTCSAPAAAAAAAATTALHQQQRTRGSQRQIPTSHLQHSSACGVEGTVGSRRHPAVRWAAVATAAPRPPPALPAAAITANACCQPPENSCHTEADSMTLTQTPSLITESLIQQHRQQHSRSSSSSAAHAGRSPLRRAPCCAAPAAARMSRAPGMACHGWRQSAMAMEPACLTSPGRLRRPAWLTGPGWSKTSAPCMAPQLAPHRRLHGQARPSRSHQHQQGR